MNLTLAEDSDKMVQGDHSDSALIEEEAVSVDLFPLTLQLLSYQLHLFGEGFNIGVVSWGCVVAYRL